MPALDPTMSNVFHNAAARLVAIDVELADSPLARVAEVADVLEELFVRVIVDALAHVVGTPPTDPVLATPLAVWDVIRDLRTRLERVENDQDLAHGELVDRVNPRELAATTGPMRDELADLRRDLEATRETMRDLERDLRHLENRKA